MSHSLESIQSQVASKWMQIMQRYRSEMNDIDWDAPIFELSGGLDSMDLAEFMAWVEQQYGVALLDHRDPVVEYWRDVPIALHRAAKCS